MRCCGCQRWLHALCCSPPALTPADYAHEQPWTCPCCGASNMVRPAPPGCVCVCCVCAVLCVCVCVLCAVCCVPMLVGRPADAASRRQPPGRWPWLALLPSCLNTGLHTCCPHVQTAAAPPPPPQTKQLPEEELLAQAAETGVAAERMGLTPDCKCACVAGARGALHVCACVQGWACEHGAGGASRCKFGASLACTSPPPSPPALPRATPCAAGMISTGAFTVFQLPVRCPMPLCR
jgi:hypothetical protein